MKFLIFAFLYVMIGAVIGSVYYYLDLRENRYSCDADISVLVGALWPVVAPFAFGLYFARKFSERERK